jgi:hypothetical protein
MANLGVLVFLISPLLFGFVLRLMIPAESDWGRAGLAFSGAGLSALWLVVSNQQSDGITAAAGLALLPVLLLILLVPAGLGVHLASLREPKK